MSSCFQVCEELEKHKQLKLVVSHLITVFPYTLKPWTTIVYSYKDNMQVLLLYIYIYTYIYNASVPFDPLVRLLDTPFQNSPDSQSQEKNLNILKTKRVFEVK